MKIISSILFLTASVLVFFFLIDPLYGDVKELRLNVSTYNSALSNSTDLQKTRDGLVESYKQISEKDREKLNHLLPSTINNIELILEIEKIANMHGMPVSDIKFDSTMGVNTNTEDGSPSMGTTSRIMAENDPASYLPYGIFPISFSIEGKYSVFLDFLNDLEKNLRIVDVKSISFNVPESSTGEQTVDVKNRKIIDPNIYRYLLKVETYWLK
jgi:Tfp pilus assembly protein PilO